MRDESEQAGPATPFERGFFAFFLAVVLGLFVAEIIHDYHPTKLFALFFVLCWIPLLVIHELGHALTAGLFGSRIHRIVIGVNKLMYDFRIKGVPIEIRMIPLSGFVSHSPRRSDGLRWKSALIYFMGPGAELLAVLALALIFGFDTLTTYSEEIPKLLLQGFAMAAVWGAVTNLFPFSIHRGDRILASDGLGIWYSLTMPLEELKESVLSREDEEALEEEEGDQWWR